MHRHGWLQGKVEFLVAETADGKLDLHDSFVYDSGTAWQRPVVLRQQQRLGSNHSKLKPVLELLGLQIAGHFNAQCLRSFFNPACRASCLCAS